MNEGYIPTEEERKKFGRLAHGYSVKKPDVSKTHKSLLKDLYNISNLLLNHKSYLKKFYDLVWTCYGEEYANPKKTIEYILKNVNGYPNEEKILNKLEELKGRYHVV